MSAVVAPLTVEQFRALPEEEGVRRELIDGEVITMAWAGQPHEVVKAVFFRELGYYFKLNPIGWVMGETTYRLGPHDAPVPDVSVVLKGRLQPGPSSLIPICPDIAIEVVSSEKAKDLQAKAQLYLKHGARAVWVAYIELRMIQVYTVETTNTPQFDNLNGSFRERERIGSFAARSPSRLLSRSRNLGARPLLAARIGARFKQEVEPRPLVDAAGNPNWLQRHHQVRRAPGSGCGCGG
jgi:Uma2 family endonuclease